LVHQICLRTTLVTDPAALRAVDAGVAALVSSAGALSVDQAEQAIDALVLTHDPFAVRRTEASARGHRAKVFVDDASGTAHLEASMSVTDGHAVDERMNAMAHTVCDRDPRSLDARRSASLGAMGFGWDRLPCMCEREDCDAATKPAVGGIVIHLIAREDTLDPEPEPEPDPEPEPEPTPVGDLTAQRRALVAEPAALLSKPWYNHSFAELTASLSADRGEFCPATPAAILGGAVVPAPVLAQAAMHADIRRLVHPGQAPPEPRYRPGRALAEFVRCRDGTCRFPGCTRAAMITDIDHTVPYPFGPTAASNLVCLCREHYRLAEVHCCELQSTNEH
jgi:hypothetical protein